jgi:hypothetical protein
MFIDPVARWVALRQEGHVYRSSRTVGSPSVRRAMSNLHGYSIQKHIALLTEGKPHPATESMHDPPDGGASHDSR